MLPPPDVTPDPRPRRRTVDPDALRRFRLAHMNEPCERCGERPGVDPHHTVYRSRGGDDHPGNLEWLCRPCHRAVHG